MQCDEHSVKLVRLGNSVLTKTAKPKLPNADVLNFVQVMPEMKLQKEAYSILPFETPNICIAVPCVLGLI